MLYKLDGGIDHILVDEAQDTAPDQWAIVRALTEDFFAGAGAPGYLRRTDRTLFIVGDDKQSIYSFQGADPARLRTETAHYLDKIDAAGGDARAAPLTDSWRSTTEVLAFVDTVFSTAETLVAVPPPQGETAIVHIGRRQGHQGCVDLWPLEVEIKEEEREAWDAPFDQLGPGSADRRPGRPHRRRGPGPWSTAASRCSTRTTASGAPPAGATCWCWSAAARRCSRRSCGR